MSLNGAVPRYFIQAYLGDKDLGYFAAVSYLTLILARVVVALGDAVLPRLGQLYISRNSEFFLLLARYSGIVLFGGLAAVCFSIVFGKQLLAFLFRPEYASYWNVMNWMMCATTLDVVAYSIGHCLVVARYLKTQMFIFLATTLSTACACWWLIPGRGLEGAAWALGLGALVELIGSIYAGQHIAKSRPLPVLVPALQPAQARLED